MRVEAAPDSRGASARFARGLPRGSNASTLPTVCCIRRSAWERRAPAQTEPALGNASPGTRHSTRWLPSLRLPKGARGRVGVARQGYLLPAGGLRVSLGQRVRHAQRDQHRQHLLRAQRRGTSAHLRLRRHARRRRRSGVPAAVGQQSQPAAAAGGEAHRRQCARNRGRQARRPVVAAAPRQRSGPRPRHAECDRRRGSPRP